MLTTHEARMIHNFGRVMSSVYVMYAVFQKKKQETHQEMR